MIARAGRRLCTVVLVVTGIVVFGVLVLPRLFGWNAYVVTSGSMSPTFEAGSVVVDAPIDGTSVGVKDIVTFRDPEGFTTHRVIGLQSTVVGGRTVQTLTTQGDANEDPDPQQLDPRNVVGQARFAVPYLGHVVELVKTPIGAGLLAVLFLVVVFTGSDRTSRRKPTGSAVDEAKPREAVAA